MTKLTERLLARTFASAIASPVARVQRRRVRHVVPELDSWRGVADFVATPTEIATYPGYAIEGLKAGITTSSVALVGSRLESNREHTGADLAESTGLSESGVRRCISDLRSAGIVEKVSDDSYVIAPPFADFVPNPGIELWAYELKLEDWVQAFYQALRYKAFAHRVWVVVPEDFVHRAERQNRRLLRFRVGLLAVDAKRRKVRTVIAAPEGAPASRADHLFATSSFLRKLDEMT